MSAEIKAKLEGINNDLLKVPQLKAIQDALNVPIGMVVLGVLGVCVLLVGFDLPFSNWIVTIIGVLYPCI